MQQNNDQVTSIPVLLSTPNNLFRQMVVTKWHWLTLGLIMLLAFTLRIWGIEYGLPYIYHVDEHYYINTALKLGAGIINNPPYAPTGLSNLLFGEYASYYAVGKLAGIFTSTKEFESVFLRDPSNFYFLGRLTSALLGTATCFTLYMLGKKVFTPIMGLVAAGFLAVSFLHVRDSHYSVPDVAMTFFVTLAITLSAVALHNNSRRYIYMASLAAGLAIAMKWTALPVVITIGWASLWVGIESGKHIIGRFVNWSTGFTVLTFVMGFALGSPQIFINPTPYISEAIQLAQAGRGGGFSIWQVDTLPGWLFYGKTLLIGVGPILLILGITGILRQLILTVKTGDKVSIVLLSFPLVYYMIMGSTRNYFVRYSLPLLPFIALFAAETVIGTLMWVLASRQRRLSWILPVILIIVAIAQPLIQSIRHDILLTRQDTRTLAKQWIEANIPAEAKIAVDWPTHSPPLSTPEKVLPYSHKTYDVMVAGTNGLSSHPMTWYLEQNYDYLISSSFINELRLVDKAWDAEQKAFYASLDQDMILLQEFRPYKDQNAPSFIFDEIYGPITNLWQRERPGPIIKIYMVDSLVSK
jgi:Dolichyl-phosphate-mannose-protein mannosyltransferase